jgi:ABC-type amino acid transport substrate-binding protein
MVKINNRTLAGRVARLGLAASLLAGLVWPAGAAEPPLRVLLREKPLPEGQTLQGQSFQQALGAMLAQKMKRSVRYLSLPRKRLPQALQAGEADVLCGYIPEWLPGPFRWSTPFIDVSDLLISSTRVAPLDSITQLAGKPIGTLSGYRYPRVEQILEQQFVRSDSVSVKANLQMLLAGRYDYAIVGEAALRYYLQHDFPKLPLNPPQVLHRVRAQCALSPASPLTLTQLNQAISQIQRDGSYARLLAANPWH